MVVSHLLDLDVGNALCIDSPVVQRRQRVVVRLEDQSVWPPEVDGKFAGSILMELVAVPRYALHVGQAWRGPERHEAPLEQLPVILAPRPSTLPVIGARLLQFPVGPGDFDSWTPL